MADTKTSKSPQSEPQPRLADVWRVVVLNDANHKEYVVVVLQKVLGFPDHLARKHMWEAHKTGRATVWAGQREQAEAYTFALHRWNVSAIIESDERN